VGNHPRQNLDHQQQRTHTKDPHQRPELATVQFCAATHVQSKIALLAAISDKEPGYATNGCV
jgi:hypothetical protein